MRSVVTSVFYTAFLVVTAHPGLADEPPIDPLIEAVEALDEAALVDVLDSLDTPAPTSVPPTQEDFFERYVRPVLAEHCFECHGPDVQENGLRLDGRDAMLNGGERGPAMVPGDPSASRLVNAIRREGELKMPPENELPADAVDALTEWIAMDAPWPEGRPIIASDKVDAIRDSHWAYQPVRNPELPAVADASWVRNDIDRFILARIETAGVPPSPEADRRTLIRRASYDLTGLPPTMDEVVAFASDTSPDAYERMIDQFLDSPRYGERWARHWLDVARYSDTKGYVFEEDRFFPYSHTYRDYVVQAFNDDVPYDRFILEQLAADLLDLGDDKRALAAMGFLTLGRRYLNNVHDITDDRIDVVSRGLLGLTVSCARCHDHKYDPIPTEDYYSMYGVFRSTREPKVDELPLIADPDPDDPQYQEYLGLLEEKQAAYRSFRHEWHVKLLTEAREKAGAYLLAAHDTRDITDNAPFRELAKERVLHWFLLDRWRNYLKPLAETPGPILTPWFAFSALDEESFADGAKAFSERLKNDEAFYKSLNPHVADAFDDDPPSTMKDVADRYGELLQSVNSEWFNLLASQTQIAIQTGAAVTLPLRLKDDDAEALRMVLYAKDSATNFPESNIDQLIDIPTRDRNSNLRRAVQAHQATHPGRPDRASSLAETLPPFDPYVFKRGKPQQKGDAVPRQFLAVLTDGERTPFQEGSGRLELANAIASRDNPLTARVFVNRVWAHHFGEPIVGTTSDFGVRSDAPTHPDLLDYLATQFMNDGWSIKKLHRTIMLSATYRQSSAGVSPESDPENRLLARQNAKRLDFEAMRDSLLSASGKLDLEMGGPAESIIKEPFTTRRTIYGQIERQNLPGLFRTFDFATPDAHSPRRYRTTVPQQALYLMNAPFSVEQARALITDISDTDCESEERVQRLYHRVLQREPQPDEFDLANRFIERYEAAPDQAAPPAPIWQNGYGEVDEDMGAVTSFTLFEHFSDKKWHAGEKVPDETFRYVSLHDRGGHTGSDNEHAAIRRWVAPRDAVIRIDGELEHGSDKGDGVTGYIVSSRDGIVWQGDAHDSETESEVEYLNVNKGDVIDFVTACKSNDGYDSFRWTPTIKVLESLDGNPAGRLEWSARRDFEGPQPVPPTPLDAWEAYAQALLLSNEFLFVD
jgi:hypothetical protein